MSRTKEHRWTEPTPTSLEREKLRGRPFVPHHIAFSQWADFRCQVEDLGLNTDEQLALWCEVEQTA